MAYEVVESLTGSVKHIRAGDSTTSLCGVVSVWVEPKRTLKICKKCSELLGDLAVESEN